MPEEEIITQELEDPEVTQDSEETEEPITEEPDPSASTEYIEETSSTDNSYMYIESNQLELTNHMIAGEIFFLGMIFGLLLFKVFWDRWKQ